MAMDRFSRLVGGALRTRWLVRTPIWLFRAGLGWLFAGCLLLLEHTGRTSGRPRFVVLEVVGRPTRDEIVVASGFGGEAQWYRNLRANPRARLCVGFRRGIPARGLALPASASAALLRGYAARHPLAWPRLRRAIGAATGQDHPAIPLVLLHLNEDAG